MSPRAKTDSRERILAAAYDLFYRQGYQATSVDEIIAQSGLSKPTVYSYFPTKEALCVAYLEERKRRDLASQREAIRTAEGPEAQFLKTAEFVRDSMVASNYRGCGFFNMVAEIPDRESPIVGQAVDYVGSFREVILEATANLKKSHAKYAGIDADRVAEDYYVIVCGAIMACQEHHEAWPLDRAVEQIGRLLRELAGS